MIDFNQILKEIDGQDLNENGTTITLKKVCVNALLMESEQSQKEDGITKLKRWHLAKKINTSTEPLQVDAEDKALIKKRIAESFATIVVGQSFEMLEV